MKGNDGFICKKCGRSTEFPSTVTIQANFGSAYDGECYTLDVCGDCVDELIERVIRKEEKNY